MGMEWENKNIRQKVIFPSWKSVLGNESFIPCWVSGILTVLNCHDITTLATENNGGAIWKYVLFEAYVKLNKALYLYWN